jgi:hypothetical protein
MMRMGVVGCFGAAANAASFLQGGAPPPLGRIGSGWDSLRGVYGASPSATLELDV